MKITSVKRFSTSSTWIEARVHAVDEIERLPDPQPARQHRHVGDEAHLAHQLIALRARIEPEHGELPAEGGEPENRLERRGLPGAVRTDEPDDAAGLDREAHPVQGARGAVTLGESTRLNYCAHRPPLRTPPRSRHPLPWPTARWPAVGQRRRRAAIPPATGRAAESWRRSAATRPRGSAGARLSSARSARPGSRTSPGHAASRPAARRRAAGSP